MVIVGNIVENIVEILWKYCGNIVEKIMENSVENIVQILWKRHLEKPLWIFVVPTGSPRNARESQQVGRQEDHTDSNRGKAPDMIRGWV